MSSDSDSTPPDGNDPAFVASGLNFTDLPFANYSLDSSHLTAGIANYRSTEVIFTTFFGVLSVCAGAAVIALLAKRSTTRSKTILITLIAAMYAVTTLFLATSLYTFSHYSMAQAKAILDQRFAEASGCLQEVVVWFQTDDPYSCATQSFAEPTVNRFAFAQPCASTVALVFNVAVGNGIVLWRAWAVWQGNKTLSWLGVVSVAATLALGLLDSMDECGLSSDAFANQNDLIYHLLVTPGWIERDKYGIALSVLSLITNVMATSLFAYKTWQHRRLIREHFKSQRRVSQVERTLYWLVESGVVYTPIWILVVIFEIIAFEQLVIGRTDINGSILAFVSTFRPIVEGGLIPMTAIYPTVIILLVALDKSYCDTVVLSAVESGASAPLEIAGRPDASHTADGGGSGCTEEHESAADCDDVSEKLPPDIEITKANDDAV